MANYIFGRRTLSMTWMTPFDWSTSAMVTVATPPFSSVTVTLPPAFSVSSQPPTVLTLCCRRRP
jgi:hypothetical protein